MKKETDLMKRASQDLDTLNKLANSSVTPETMAYLKDVMRPVLGTLAAVSATGGLAYLMASHDKKKHEKNIADSFKATFERDSKFKENPVMFAQRFNELTMISPTIAKNPAIAAKLIDNHQDGFGIDDIHKLTAIEMNASHARQAPNPLAAGRAASINAFGNIFRVFGPDVMHGMQQSKAKADAAHEKRMEEMMNQKPSISENDIEALSNHIGANVAAGRDPYHGIPGFEKKSSATQTVSDEVLGEMLADRAIMLKTAGIGGFGAGIDALKNSFMFMAPALALGGGAALIGQALESRRNAQLASQADLIFKKLKSESDIVKGDPLVAAEAFETLKSFAPSLAARPLVARTFIENVTRMGNLDQNTVSNLAEAENKVRGLSQNKGGFLTGFKSHVDVVKGVTDFMHPSVGDNEKLTNAFKFHDSMRKK